MYSALRRGCHQLISLNLLCYVCVDGHRVIRYGLMVSGNVLYGAGWAEANSETMADASAEVTSVRGD